MNKIDGEVDTYIHVVCSDIYILILFFEFIT